jgi:hypothetical protein
MKPYKYITSVIFLFPLTLFLMSACFKQSTGVEVNPNFGDSVMSIKNFRKLHTIGNVEYLAQPLFIEGVVVANDEHDNIYKAIYIQDSTGGLVVQLDGLSLYQTYPIGSKIKINAQQLLLTDYRRMVQLVGAVDTSSGILSTSGIPSALFSKFIKLESEHNIIRPLIVAYKNLGDSLQGRLIQINAVEFSAADTAQTYADKKNKLGASRSLKFCTGGTIYLRTGGYADFAGVKTPTGNGIVIGVYSVFNAEKQLLLRDTSDILLIGKRCTGAAWLQKLPQTASKLND